MDSNNCWKCCKRFAQSRDGRCPDNAGENAVSRGPRGQGSPTGGSKSHLNLTVNDLREAIPFLLAHHYLYYEMPGISAAIKSQTEGAEKQETEQTEREHQGL